MVKQSYCTGDTGISVVSRPSDGLCTISFIIWNFLKIILFLCISLSLFLHKNTTDCVPFEEGLEYAEEEEPPKSLLEVSDTEKKKYSRQNSDLNKLPEITWRCSRSQWWNDAPSSDASRQDGKREEEEKEEQEEQEAPLWQQWFGERREEEGETKEGTAAFQVWPRVSRGWSPQTLIQLWSFLRLSGAGRGRQAYKADGGDNAGGREEEAVQQPAGSQGTNWGGDGGLPHEALPSRWPHGLLPGPVRSLVFIFAHRPPGIPSRTWPETLLGELTSDFWKVFDLFAEAGRVVYNCDKPCTVLSTFPTFVLMYQ